VGRAACAEGGECAPRAVRHSEGRGKVRKAAEARGSGGAHTEGGTAQKRQGERRRMHAESRYRVEGRGGVPKARVACKVSEASVDDEAA
jgi:hypothetical protein